MTLYELLESVRDEPDNLTTLLINLDACLEYIHNKGYYIYDFNLKKILLENGKLTLNSFQNVITPISDLINTKEINIFQLCKIGITAYNSMAIDGNINQEYYNFIRENIEYFNNGKIPDNIYEYYQEVFLNSNITYLNNYLNKKDANKSDNQSSLSRRKSLATDIGVAYTNNDDAYVKILFIPTLMVFTYIISLFIYFILLK